MRALELAALLPLAAGAAAAAPLRARRPAAAGWRRTQCGGPTGAADLPSEWAADVSADTQPLPAYPRPQMVRGRGASFDALRDRGDPASWVNLNGLWEFEPAEGGPLPFGRTLARSILVPFPVESCLSGVAPQRSKEIIKDMFYRLEFDLVDSWLSNRTLLHFGAVDWQASVYLNGQLLGSHTGGFDGFSFDLTAVLKAEANELIVHVWDPSDDGPQPNGKQRIGAIDHPGGDTYTPTSGIWQTVWLEQVPKHYIQNLQIDQASTEKVSVIVDVAGEAGAGSEVAQVTVSVARPGGQGVLATAVGDVGKRISVAVPDPKLWSPDSPTLYDLTVATRGDEVVSYFGLRTFALGAAAGGAKRPLFNGGYTFLAGVLDQSFWPDGLYTAPTDEALEFDLRATRVLGLNLVRLHQKVNPERWYYHADRLGLAVMQDAPQKYGGASNATIPHFVDDLKRMIIGRGSHPCIIQWEAFNEEDCWAVFTHPPHDLKGIVALARALDPTRLVDTDSGGKANAFGIGDVNDVHTYPYPPSDLAPSGAQYAMVGEFGGTGAFTPGKEWVADKCWTYLKASSPSDQVQKYLQMAKMLETRVANISASVYTQLADVELECDGFLNYDRSNKFSPDQVAAIRSANQAIINASRAAPQPGAAGTGGAGAAPRDHSLVV